MTNEQALLALAEKADKAAAAYDRVVAMTEGKPATVEAVALAAGLVLSLHGHLFAECAAALREARLNP